MPLDALGGECAGLAQNGADGTTACCLDLVVTELAVIGFSKGCGTLLETAPGVSKRQVLEATEAELSAPDEVPEMKF